MAGRHLRRVDTLSRLMQYILGNRPDEFGLVPDRHGFISIKELLKVIHEEPDMGYVRQSHLAEVIVHDRSLFEVAEKKIRATKRSFPSPAEQEPLPHPPKLLFKGIKQKAYPAVLAYGLTPGAEDYVVMTTDRELAVHIGRRRDQSPVIIEIQAQTAAKSGTAFFAFGDSLYVADAVPARFIHGPPLPKERPEEKKPIKPKVDVSPGSFILDVGKDPDRKRQDKARKKRGWKEEARKTRKRKHPKWE
ncbi:MAG: RNA 2'-phosphotransferase [Thermodesulfobacteriota bacterium]